MPPLKDLLDDFTFDQINDLITKISTDLRADKFEEFDQFLAQADVTKMALMEITTYMRIPFMGRDRLPSWKGFVLRARDEYNRRGEDGDLATRGLL